MIRLDHVTVTYHQAAQPTLVDIDLQVPADILTSAADPVIPVDDFHDWQLPANATVEIAAHGGHCAFLRDASLRGYAEDWVAQHLATVL